MNAGRTKIGRKWERVIDALLLESTQADAAKAAGISESTLRRSLKNPEFQAAYLAAKKTAHADALDLLRTSLGGAVRTLRQELSAEKSSDRIRAALGLLDHAFKATTAAEHEAKIRELEAIVSELQKQEDEQQPPPPR